jgi:hypothetical protein
MVSWLERGYAGSRFVDDAYTLVTKNSTRLTARNITFENMQVGTADRRLGYLNDGVGRRGDLRLRTLFHGLLGRTQINKSLHDGSPAFCGVRLSVTGLSISLIWDTRQ